MNQLAPNTQFTYVEQLGDPTDQNQNYVQCVVRYSASSAVIATINMTNVSGQRFTGKFQVPTDPTGLGYYLDITTTVYSDSGYSQVNTNYQTTTTTFFVLQPVTPSAFGGNGGGYDDANLLKRVQILEDLIRAIKILPHKETDLSPVIEAIESLDIPTTDLKPVIKAIQGIRIPEPIEPEKVDLYPLIEGLQNISLSHKELEEKVEMLHKEHEKKIKEMNDKNSRIVQSLLDVIPERVKETIRTSKADIFKVHLSPAYNEAPTAPKKRKIEDRVLELIKSPYVTNP